MRAACEVGVSDRGLYQGSGLGLVDDKGRVAIPASLRATLAANAPRADGKDGGMVIVSVHQDARCLIAYDQAYAATLKGQLDVQEVDPGTGRRDFNVKRGAALGELVPFDGSGRFILPELLLHQAGIAQNAFFYGVFDYFEIWDPKTLVEAEGIPDAVKAAARFYCGKKGITV